ncbi:2-succinyl-5-enolpyruvyl-6-hydroxy-3-cyclohexene-1-carboxylic-acid synthase [Halospeciosus flavus]|uniref:2-succinyl-5-enolpyruvyl-6-hydroxy-3-cyclohexene-1-carboxylate synthase n=1 Tax=Halospeciosus flavus TaxID=3032283 RepID=A0ABD5Z2I1_9EURY|nr:2-succinyl-5-enolpyruvyl-6-hydroxy-3-cyclohexene-1-carboxylic-acid synthase [Halospeciosus flavus]
MTWDVADAPNRATLFARAFVDELAKAGVDAVCVAPGSRSTPLTVALDDHPEIRVFSHLDERSAAFFALGRGKRTGKPTPIVTTSGTATANLHPAVMEADRGRVPLVVLTADRPPELRDSGANQTVDQEKLYGSAVRYYADLPEPAAEGRKLRSLRTTAARALAETRGTKPGPVHLNFPFAKPLEPTDVPPDDPSGVPEDFAEEHPLAAVGRDGPFVSVTEGRAALADADADRFADLVADADRGLVVAGPMDAVDSAPAVADLATASGFPLLADPLSGLRFGDHVADTPVVGGYDAYLDESVTREWPDPDLVLRFGASPTSKPLRKYLARTGARQVVVDPTGEWREAEFRATDLVTAEGESFARAVADRLDRETVTRTVDTWGPWARAESAHWDVVTDARGAEHFEGAVLSTVAETVPDPTTLFVSNSMPVRDVDRFAEPRVADVTALANRGASGIDGITSSALGAGSAADGDESEETVLVTGDLAYYHDTNGLLALGRCDQEATIVLINNDGGGIFHMLPIEEFDAFERQFKTPHGLDFAPTEDIYDLSFARTDLDGFPDCFAEALDREGTTVVEVHTDAERSHRTRERLKERVLDRL